MEILTSLMKERNVNRVELTKEIHIGKNQIKYWENNNCIPDGATLLKIANFFDVSVDYLLGKTDKKETTTPDKQPLRPKEQTLLDICKVLPDDVLDKLISEAASYIPKPNQ